jgi:hypothetical protein
MSIKKLAIICLLIIGSWFEDDFKWLKENFCSYLIVFFSSLYFSKGTFTRIDATVYCPDPLNIQTSRLDATPTPASTCSAGIVTCGTGLTNPGCGVKIKNNFNF